MEGSRDKWRFSQVLICRHRYRSQLHRRELCTIADFVFWCKTILLSFEQRRLSCEPCLALAPLSLLIFRAFAARTPLYFLPPR